jgi:protein-tyrosine phosphatase
MFDFHSHILPGIDDGSASLEETLALLKASREQGVKAVVATPHFSAEAEDPTDFLKRREESVKSLLSVYDNDTYPEVFIGAEVSYYPGISFSNEIEALRILGTRFILIEMPFRRWTKRMIDEIIQMEQRLDLIPVIAHIERYGVLRRKDILHAFVSRGVLIQVNASFFIDKKTRKKALKMLSKGEIHLIGSDMHNLENRPQNIKEASDIIIEKSGSHNVKLLNRYAEYVLKEAASIQNIL